MMIRRALILTAGMMMLLIAKGASANPPNAIHASYDAGRGELNVIVEHPVVDKWQHFIKEVTVYKNGARAWGQEFDFQTSFRNLTIPPIKLSAVDGDSIRIVAICNTSGQGERTITVGVVEKEAPSGPIEHDIAE